MKTETLKKQPLLGIFRGIKEEHVDPVADCCIGAGLKSVEITMNTPGAPHLIRRMIANAGDRLTVGAGTVLTMTDLYDALDAGATFIVTPVVVAEIIEFCARNQIPVFPGALTPTEIYQAWQLGATLVKVFPAWVYGPAYFKELKAPMDDLRLIAVGGVNEQNIGEYLGSGADAVAFGGAALLSGPTGEADFQMLRTKISKLVQACEAWVNR